MRFGRRGLNLLTIIFFDNLINCVIQTDGSEGNQGSSSKALQDEGYKGFIKVFRHGTTSGNLLNFFKDRILHNTPISLEKTPHEDHQVQAL